jgi:serine protease AprX
LFITCINRSRSVLVAALVAVVALLTLGGATAAHAVPSAQAQLAAKARKAPARKVEAIAQFKPGFAEKKARALVRKHHGRVTSRLPLIHGLAIKLPAKEAAALDGERGVVAVTLNGKVHGQGANSGRLNTQYPKTVGADKLWARGITGNGVGVAVIDSGVAGDLVDFKGSDGRSRVVANVITAPGAQKAGDGLGHGTHVAGIIAGNSFNRDPRDPLYGDYVGVAPDANLVVVKASDEVGNSTVLDVINGIQFVVDHKDQFNIRVLNLSLSTDVPQSYKTDPLDAAVEYAWQHGIVVVAASGNRGSSADAVQYAPANDPFVISVGGADEQGDYGKGARAYWSSAGRTQDGFYKPEVMAPGAHIVSTLAPNSAFQYLCPTCIVGGAYFKAGGTSMAAPVVSGAVALLLQAKPYLSPDQVKAALTATDKPIKGSYGAGEIDLDAAANLGYVQSANRGIMPNYLIAALNRSGGDLSTWTRSSWSTATGALVAGWARSSWSCVGCGALGAAVDPTRSSWSRSSWSSFGEGAEDEAAQLAAEQAAEEAAANPPPAAAPAAPAPAAPPAATATATATPEVAP